MNLKQICSTRIKVSNLIYNTIEGCPSVYIAKLSMLELKLVTQVCTGLIGDMLENGL